MMTNDCKRLLVNQINWALPSVKFPMLFLVLCKFYQSWPKKFFVVLFGGGQILGWFALY